VTAPRLRAGGWVGPLEAVDGPHSVEVAVGVDPEDGEVVVLLAMDGRLHGFSAANARALGEAVLDCAAYAAEADAHKVADA
jgi:hypothetical protein